MFRFVAGANLKRRRWGRLPYTKTRYYRGFCRNATGRRIAQINRLGTGRNVSRIGRDKNSELQCIDGDWRCVHHFPYGRGRPVLMRWNDLNQPDVRIGRMRIGRRD